MPERMPFPDAEIAYLESLGYTVRGFDPGFLLDHGADCFNVPPHFVEASMSQRDVLLKACEKLVAAARTVDNRHHAGICVYDGDWSDLNAACGCADSAIRSATKKGASHV